MTAQKLEKDEWRPFFDGVSKILAGTRAEIEVESLELGDQVEAEWLPLHGLVYDQKDDLVEVLLEGHDHMIHKPREIYVDTGVGGLASFEIINADGVKEIVMLREPLALPPPAQHA
jgi:hypothetical protein